MKLLSIKIKISDRIYPMKVDPTDENFVRKASKLLEERIGAYQKKMRIQDPQDLLAMVAFDCLVESLKMQQKDQTTTHAVMQKITAWHNHMEQVLEENSTKI